MFSPRRQPFLYLTAALLSGIVIDRSIRPGCIVVLPAGLFLVGLAIFVFLRRHDRLTTSLLVLVFVLVGCLLSYQDRFSVVQTRLKTLYDSKVITPEDPVELDGTLAAPPEPAPGAFYLNLTAKNVRLRNETLPASGSVRLLLSTIDQQAQHEFKRLALDYGSRIRVLVRLERPRGYSNPGSPDFNEFLERRGYDLKGVIKSPLLIEPLGMDSYSSVLRLIYHLRIRMLASIDTNFKQPVSGTLKAMLTGNRYYLDSHTIDRLQQGSTFHTLVIAGLHIGIIAWALLGGRSALKRRRIWRVIVCLIVLWGYAVMVGLAAPVTRATAMITIGLIAPLLFRQATSINTVALSAFVMIALKPSLVTDPGFQLSFAAVAGIVVLALPIAEKLRQLGEWRPNWQSPYPPNSSSLLRYLAETFFWDQQAFVREMRQSPIRYRLPKAQAARVLGRLRIQSLIRNVVLLMLTSTAIQLSTLPLMAFYFNRVAPVGVLLNVFAGLLTGILMLTALAEMAIAGIGVPIAHLGWIINAAHYLLVRAIEPFNEIPAATFRVAHYHGRLTVVYALYFIPLVLMALLIDRWQPIVRVLPRDRIIDGVTQSAKATKSAARKASVFAIPALTVLCAVLMVVSLAVVVAPPVAASSRKLTIHFLDVGQGDSAFIVFPGGGTMLVDGGGELQFNRSSDQTESISDFEEDEFSDGAFTVGEAVVSRFIWSLGWTRVDYIVATHADSDHIGGLSAVVRNFRVGEAIVGHAPDGDPEYDRFARVVEHHGIPMSSVRAGERFEIEGVGVEILWPPAAHLRPVTSSNNDSVVMRLVYGSVAVILAGDIEQSAEESLIRSVGDLRADILKVPHHGSKTSSTVGFLDAVDPKCAVISVGERSRFGHPHAVVVNRYAIKGIRVFQTGVSGTVTVEIDGNGYVLNSYRR